MKELPILFSAPMVRAILGGRKTQTRRVVKQSLEQLGDGNWYAFDNKGLNYRVNARHTTVGAWASLLQFCPYGRPGDRLWVRETFFAYGRHETWPNRKKGGDGWHFVDMTQECDRAYQYAAENPSIPLAVGHGPLPGWYQRPSIHMPRWASRITLEVTAVRIERLQDISADDCVAEGCGAEAWWPESNARAQYQRLWDQINGPGSWDANPWVWVVEFGRVEAA